MSNQVQAQREYALTNAPKLSGLVQSIGHDVPTPQTTSTHNVENLLSSCLSWSEELEQEITNLSNRLGPVLRPDKPNDPSMVTNEKRLSLHLSTVACRLEALSGRLMEQTRRLVTIKELVDL